MGYGFTQKSGNKNVIALYNDSGVQVAGYSYGPFGQLLSASGPLAQINPLRFSSEYFDDETGLVYYNYRYYSPRLGRWLSRDPIGETGGLNLYGIANNELINDWDYLGLVNEIDLTNIVYNETASLRCGDKTQGIRLNVAKISIKNSKNAGAKAPAKPDKEIYNSCCKAAKDALQNPSTEWDFYILHNIKRHGIWNDNIMAYYGFEHGLAERDEPVFIIDKSGNRIKSPCKNSNGEKGFWRYRASAVSAIQSEVIPCNDSNASTTYVMYQKKPNLADQKVERVCVVE